MTQKHWGRCFFLVFNPGNPYKSMVEYSIQVRDIVLCRYDFMGKMFVFFGSFDTISLLYFTFDNIKGDNKMTVCERMFEIIDKKSLKTADLAKKLEIKQSVISNWRKRNTNPPIKYILVICEFLEISVEKLITGEDRTNISLEEERLLNAYRLASPGIQEATRKLLDVSELETESLTSSAGKEAM